MVFRGRSTLSTRKDLIVLMSLPLLLPLMFSQRTTKQCQRRFGVQNEERALIAASATIINNRNAKRGLGVVTFMHLYSDSQCESITVLIKVHCIIVKN